MEQSSKAFSETLVKSLRGESGVALAFCHATNLRTVTADGDKVYQVAIG